MRMTIEEFIELWADGTHADIDVTESVSESFCIAYCGNQLTETGKKEWNDVLTCFIDVDEYTRYPLAVIDLDDDRQWMHTAKRARQFFYAMAGYCAESYYDSWFKD